jgi:hypothetical protein
VTAGGLDHPGALELDLPGAEVVAEQANTVAEEHGDDVELQLVEEPRLEVLLRDVRAAAHRDVLVARSRPGLLERGFDAVDIRVDRRQPLVRRPTPSGKAEGRGVALPLSAHLGSPRVTFSPADST